MLRNVRNLLGFGIRATDGVIGTGMISTLMTRTGLSAIS